MRTFPLDTLAVFLGLLLRRIRIYFKLEPAWEKADDSVPVAARSIKQPDTEAHAARVVVGEPEKGLWVDCSYCWVVVCKNHWFHRRRNPFNVHRIPLGETDGISTRPAIKQHFIVQCDECFREYRYKPSEVLRWEMEPPPSFIPHPLFRE